MTKNEAYRIVYAKHDCSEKKYIFEVPKNIEIKAGDILLVNTIQGVTIATAMTGVIAVDGENVNELLIECGAYLPLKKVNQVAGQMLQTYISRKTRNEIIDLIKKDNGHICFDYDIAFF